MLQFRVLKIGLLFAAALLPVVGMDRAMAADISPGENVIQSVSPTPSEEPHIRPMNDAEITSAMCVLGATVGMAMTYLAGPNEVIMLVVGGVVVPSSPSILFLSLFGTMAAAGCTIGALATPAVSWWHRRYAINR